MIDRTPKLDFNDLLIPPAPLSEITSRKEVNVFDQNGMLPLFTAPMDTVISLENYKIFEDQKIYPILPRTTQVSIDTHSGWVALSLKAFEEYFGKFGGSQTPNYWQKGFVGKKYILCDIANGHMKKLVDIVKIAKSHYGDDLVLMVGNIANPKTFGILNDAGADYIRVGIGNGGGCLTTQNTGIGYPMASLIDEIRTMFPFTKAKLVADGGMKDYPDIYKALALGADYCMVGSILNKALESAGDTYFANIHHPDGTTEPGNQIDQYSEEAKLALRIHGTRLYKKFRGMSTKEVQKIIGNGTLRTSEGITKMQTVEYSLSGWVENFKDYLATHMSYVGKKTLSDFIGRVDLITISHESQMRFKK